MAATLRPYQIEAVQAVKNDWYGEHPNTLLVAACGSGKTVIFLDILTTEVPKNNGRGLILVQRDELASQPRQKIRQFWPEWDRLSGTIQAKENDTDARLTVASVQSLIQPRRMKALLSHGPITHVVCDESHHILSPVHVSIINQLREANPELRLLGVTATPVRGDKKGLIQMFTHVAARYDIRLLVKLGYLVPPRGMAVETGADISKTRKGADYDGESVAQIYGKANVWELVVSSHQKYASDRKASVAFTPDVKSAYQLAEAFRSAGITAEAVDGTTPTDERRAILDRFRSGKTSVVANCNVLMEGTDIPQIDCIHWCRPTMSDSMYCQGIGRSLRTYPGKLDAIILDYCPADYRNIVLAGDILGRLSSEGGDVGTDDPTDSREHGGEAFAVDSQGNLDYGDPNTLIARSLDYLNATPYAWHLENNRATLAIRGWDGRCSQTLEIHAARNQQCLLVLITSYGNKQPVRVTKVATGTDVQELIAIGSEYADKHADTVLVQRGRSWQQMPPSPAQLNMLHWFDVPPDRIEALSKGEASKLITHFQAQQALERFSETVRR